MYHAHFNLREPPFPAAPDPAYLYMSARHQEALGHLMYGVGQYGGFVQLTGEAGVGKTTIVQALLRQDLGRIEVAHLHDPRGGELEFVAAVCEALGMPHERPARSMKALVDALNEHLLKTHAAGGHTILIVDEAQNLDPGVLEQVRLLTNLETDKEKLLRIVLVGQPALIDTLQRRELRQLDSRITTRYHLPPLSAEDTPRYIVHRLGVAGGASDLFSAEAMRRVHRHARGIPRQINSVCDRALLGAYAKGLRTVTAEVVDQAAAETLGSSAALPRQAWIEAARGRLRKVFALTRIEGVLAVLALIIAGVVLSDLLHRNGDRPAAKAVPAAPRPVPPAAPPLPTAAPAPAAAAPVAATPPPPPAPKPAPPPVPAPAPSAPPAAPPAPAVAPVPPPASAAPPPRGEAAAKPAAAPAIQPASPTLPKAAPQPVAQAAAQQAKAVPPAGQEMCRSAARKGPECEDSLTAWSDLNLGDPLRVLETPLPEAVAPKPAPAPAVSPSHPARSKPAHSEKPVPAKAAATPKPAVAETKAAPAPVPARPQTAASHPPRVPVITVPFQDAVPLPGQAEQGNASHAPLVSLPAPAPPATPVPKPEAAKPDAAPGG